MDIVYERDVAASGAVLVAAFEGWNDGGEAATTALTYLRDRWGAEPFAHIDPEEFFDFQQTRPHVRLDDDGNRAIDWPETRFYSARAGGRDVILLLGVEPNLRWRRYCDAVVKVARDCGVSMVVTLGAFLADVPHTRAAPVVGTAGDTSLAERLGIARSRYEGPVGIVGALGDAVARAGIDAASLWAAAPHYLPGDTNPRAALALVGALTGLLGLPVETDTLERAAAAWQERISAVVEDNDELSAYVRGLEEEAEREAAGDEVPSGEALAAELERFLRQHGGD